jgi:type IV secretory pathway TraG/TraD family ATPase VirD4
MVLSSQEKNSIEKVTLLLPKLLKEEVMQLKESLQVSMNSIYQMAIAEYVAKKKREQLRQEALMMVDEYNTNPEILELIDFEEDLNEY